MHTVNLLRAIENSEEMDLTKEVKRVKRNKDIDLAYISDENDICVGVGINSFDRNRKITYHRHDYYEMELIVEGEITHTVNDKQYKAKRGDVYLVTVADFHSINFDTDDVKMASLGFTPQAIPTYLADKVMALDFSSVSLDVNQFKTIYRELEFLKQQYEKSPKMSENDLLRISFEKTLLLFLDYISLSGKQKNTSGNLRPLQKALDFMHKNYASQITLEQTAAEAEMVPTYFSRYFKQNMNMRFMQYLNRLRCNVAAAFLSSTSLSMEEIALRTGYMTASYFSKVFRSVHGMSPLEYRQKTSKNKPTGV